MTIFADAQNIWGSYFNGTALNNLRENENHTIPGRAKKMEDGSEKKTTCMDVSLVQSGQTLLASNHIFNVINKVLAINPFGSLNRISRKASILTQIAIVTPILFSGYYLDDSSKEEISSPSLAGRVSLFINKHAGTISQIAAAISFIALFALGSKKEAVTTLMIMGIGVADRNQLLPKRFSYFFNEYLPIIGSASGIILAEGKIMKLFCAINLASRFKAHFKE